MTKTEEIDKALCYELSQLVDVGRVACLEIDGVPSASGSIECQATLSSQPIELASPGVYWGSIGAVLVPNPRRHWWCFWRPRCILLSLSETDDDQGKP
jgi:hypothetical protein